MRLSVATWAKIGIAIQFLALIRTLAEYFRLKMELGADFALETGEPYVVGALIAAVLCFASVGLAFFERYRGSIALAVATVVALLAYKLIIIG